MRDTQIRASIKALFPDRDCFPLVRPMSDEKMLAKLETLDTSTYRPEFQQVCWLVSQAHSSMAEAAAHQEMLRLSMLPADLPLIALHNCLSGSGPASMQCSNQLPSSWSDMGMFTPPAISSAHSRQLSVFDLTVVSSDYAGSINKQKAIC